MKLLQSALLGAAIAAAAQAGAQAPATDPLAPTAVRGAPPAEPYLPPVLRRPLRDAGPAVLRYQSMQKLKKRFDAADLDGNGTLSREEARQAGLGVVERNFDHIDSAQRGAVSFDDVKTYLIQRREEARSR